MTEPSKVKPDQSEHVEELDRLEVAIAAGDVREGLQAASDLIDRAVAEAQLDAAGTAIDSNLATLDRLKAVTAERDRAVEALRTITKLGVEAFDLMAAGGLAELTDLENAIRAAAGALEQEQPS